MSDELGDGTSPETMSELEEVAQRRAASLGRPVVVAGFASSGRALVLDYDGPEQLDEGELVAAGRVAITPTRPPPAA
jgi:hypothetical protein